MRAYYRLKEELYSRTGKKMNNKSQKGYWRWLNKTAKYRPKNYESKRLTSIWEQLISGLSVKGKRVLDYGCSNGVWSSKYKEMGALVTGIDYIRPPLYTGDFIMADVSEYKAERQAELIHTAQVLMHLDPPKQEMAAKLIHNNLKKWGYVLLIEKRTDTSFHIWGRNWEETLTSIGFTIIKTITNKDIIGILAQKR